MPVRSPSRVKVGGGSGDRQKRVIRAPSHPGLVLLKTQREGGSAGTETSGPDGRVGRVVPSEEGRVQVDAVDQARDAELHDAPVMTFNTRAEHWAVLTQNRGPVLKGVRWL